MSYNHLKKRKFSREAVIVVAWQMRKLKILIIIVHKIVGSGFSTYVIFASYQNKAVCHLSLNSLFLAETFLLCFPGTAMVSISNRNKQGETYG
jgi:hypothetical protein